MMGRKSNKTPKESIQETSQKISQQTNQKSIQELKPISDTMSFIKNTFMENNSISTKYVFCHCRTQYDTKMVMFIWSITNFWKTINFIDTLTSSDIEKEPYKIDMSIDKEKFKLYFFIQSTVANPKKQINIYKYNIYIQGSDGPALCTEWKQFFFVSNPLYEVNIETLFLNKEKYLPNDTFSVHFMFELYENVLHNTMCENTLETQQLTTVTNDFASGESNSFVTFVVEGERFRINKLLVCAASSVLSKMLKKCNDNAEEDAEEEVEITNITNYIFEIIISYINTKDYFELKYDDAINKNILLHLLAAAHRFDIKDLKVICEKRLTVYITKENVVTYLDIAINNNAEYMANYAKRLIKLHIDDIKHTTKFLEKIKNNPEILFDIMEQELFKQSARYYKYNDD